MPPGAIDRDHLALFLAMMDQPIPIEANTVRIHPKFVGNALPGGDAIDDIGDAVRHRCDCAWRPRKVGARSRTPRRGA